jgi:hypothetical protein
MSLSPKHPYLLTAAFVAVISSLSSCSQTSETTEVTGADPGVLEAPIAFVKRPIPVDDNGNEIQPDLREPLFFMAGGDVYLRSNSTATATQTNITADITGGQGDVKDLKPSIDGSKLLFSLRLFDEDENDDDIPSWNIYEYDLETKTLRCIIDSDVSTPICDGLIAEEGDDLAPAYLPDGRIVFSSNRQKQAGQMLTDERKPRFRALDEDEDTMALVLHVMNDEGSEIQQISFNQSHDLDPSVLSSGEIVFTRWDNAAANDAMHLYKINPNGTNLQVLYGVHSHDTGSTNAGLAGVGENDATIQFTQAEEMENGRIMVITRPYSGTYGGGDIISIDAGDFVNIEQPIASMAGLQGPAQRRATINPVSAADEISHGGRYSSAWPLWDGSNRVLVSKSSCVLSVGDIQRPCIEPYLSEQGAQEASPAYSIWLYDMNNDAQKVIVRAEQGKVITDIVALQARNPPPIKGNTLNTIWKEQGIGAIHIKSVYDFGSGDFNGCFLSDCIPQDIAADISSVNDLGDPAKATADQRPARFVRFVKAVSLPDEDDPSLENAPDLDREAFGPRRNQAMREIIGYAPVEPDGSVKVKLPANIPLAINVLDKNGQRIGARHENWFQVVPGETLECTGCHAEQNGVTPLPHQRNDAEAPSINSGITATTIANTINPDTGEIYIGNIGETLAEVRFRHAAAEPQISANLVYEDVWTDPNVRSVDASFSYRYEDMETPPPTSPTCLPDSAWDFKCRITINYPQHIQPLWELARNMNINGVDTDITCTSCHSAFDEALQLARVPAGQLNLTSQLDADDNSQRVKSYLELFTADQGQELDEDGNVINRQIEVPVLDENGDPLFETDADGNQILDPVTGLPIPITEFIDDPAFRFNATMSGNGARASYFLLKMSDPTATRNGSAAPGDADYVDHSAFMSKDELRLVSEWLDIGAQYFNDPFDPDVPMN